MVPTKSKSAKTSKKAKKSAKPAKTGKKAPKEVKKVEDGKPKISKEVKIKSEPKKKSSKVTKKEKPKEVKKAVKETPSFDITKHALVPKHRIMSEKEVEALLKSYNISLQQLPLIKEKDPVMEAINAKAGDVLEITRDGPTKSFHFFRRVVE